MDHQTFGGIEPELASFDFAQVVLQSIPYDGTSTWGKGADKGFKAFLEAAENMELYDIETDTEVYKKGIHLLPAITEACSPESMCEAVYQRTKKLLLTDKRLTFFGGEHSVSIGIIRAMQEKYADLSILHLDAHADLRPSYNGSTCNHACALHKANAEGHVVSVGIRSMDSSEKEFVHYDRYFLAQDMAESANWQNEVIHSLKEKVYITIDLDVFDPSILPGTGTPEPGGLSWYNVLSLLQKVFSKKLVKGFDIVELAPRKGEHQSEFLAAKLYYKMLSYWFE